MITIREWRDSLCMIWPCLERRGDILTVYCSKHTMAWGDVFGFKRAALTWPTEGEGT